MDEVPTASVRKVIAPLIRERLIDLRKKLSEDLYESRGVVPLGGLEMASFLPTETIDLVAKTYVASGLPGLGGIASSFWKPVEHLSIITNIVVETELSHMLDLFHM